MFCLPQHEEEPPERGDAQRNDLLIGRRCDRGGDPVLSVRVDRNVSWHRLDGWRGHRVIDEGYVGKVLLHVAGSHFPSGTTFPFSLGHNASSCTSL
jgi:hypothetical protein